MDIYVMSADGTNPRRLTTDAGIDESATWSLDGKQLIFVSERDGNAELYRMNADGSHIRRLTFHPATDWFPAWRPRP